MSRWHNLYLDGYAHFCTATVTDWCPMLQGEAVTTLYRVWDQLRNKLGVKVMAYVIMPDHFHIVLWSEVGMDVSRFMQRTLALTSRQLDPGGGRFWKERPRVVPVYSPKVLRTKVDYIHANPVRRGLVEDSSEWWHSSFRQLIGGLVDAPFLCDSWEGINV